MPAIDLQHGWINVGSWPVSDAREWKFDLAESDLAKSSQFALLYGAYCWSLTVAVDQPVGTGFSTVKDGAHVKSISEAISDIMEFLGGFLDRFPQQRTQKVPFVWWHF
jgi:hypothetical protein